MLIVSALLLFIAGTASFNVIRYGLIHSLFSGFSGQVTRIWLSIFFHGGELLRKGYIEQASAAFAAADHLNKRVSMRYPIKASIMEVKLVKGEYIEARNFFFQTFKKKQDAPVVFLELLYKADGKRLEFLEWMPNLDWLRI